MKTLSVFCVGTSHFASEQWTLMRALYDLTVAELELVHPDPGELAKRRSSERNAKIVFDGPYIGLTSNKFMSDRANAVVRFIKNNQPETVCLFGHSRGAVLATMIAARLHEAAPTVTGAKLWLLDLVGKTDIGMSPYLDDSVTRTAYPNVSDIVRIVMEDEPSTVMFPLQSFSVQRAGAPRVLDHVHAGSQHRPRVKLMRLPGSHGTGTQVNPMTRDGDLLPTTDITKTEPGQLWPIGEVCLISALHHLDKWGVGLRDEAHAWIGRRRGRNLLRAYAMIRQRNLRVAGGKGIQLNNASGDGSALLGTRSTQWTQTIKPNVKGERADDELNKFGTDHRQNRFVVNDQHLRVLRSTYPNLADRLETLGTGTGTELIARSVSRSDLGAELGSVRRHHGSMYFGLVGLTLDGQSVLGFARKGTSSPDPTLVMEEID